MKRGMIRKFTEDIARIAHEVAPKFGCAVLTQDGFTVLRAENMDGFTVTMHARGVRGRLAMAASFDADMARNTGCEILLRDELTRTAKRLESLVTIPKDIPEIAFGTLCPVHRPDFSDDEKPWPRVTAVDEAAWQYACTVETQHALPDAFTYCEGNRYLIRRRDDR